MERIKCPYCRKIIPQKRGKCVECGNTIFIRNGKYITEDESLIVDWVHRIEGSLGLTRKIFEVERIKLSKRFGVEASVADTIWSFLNQKVIESDSFRRKIAYFEMARIAMKEGKDTKPYISEALKTLLNDYIGMGLSRVKILGCGNRCDDSYMCEGCKEFCGKIISIEKAIETMPIPYECTNSICRCSYEIILDDLSVSSRFNYLNDT